MTMGLPPLPYSWVVKRAVSSIAKHRGVAPGLFLDGISRRPAVNIWFQLTDRKAMHYDTMVEIIARCQEAGIIFTQTGYATPWDGYHKVTDAKGTAIDDPLSQRTTRIAG